MSLINQMLRDLRDQKGRAPQAKKALKPKALERIPYLPLPLILGAAGIVFVLCVWWIAGILSEALFGFEPTAENPPAQVATQKTTLAETSQNEENYSMPVADKLTLEERIAEPETAQQAKSQNPPVKEITPEKKDSPTEKRTSLPVKKDLPSNRGVSKQPAVAKKAVEKQPGRVDSLPV